MPSSWPKANVFLFAIPWGERVILGTTDTDYQGPLADPTCDDADIEYVFDVVNDAFPQAKLSKADLVSTWAGLRPLVADPNGNPSDISRRHEVKMNEAGWWDVTGGKLTTYRLMAEETVNAIAKYTGQSKSKCRTAQIPLLEAGCHNRRERYRAAAGIRGAVKHYCRNEWVRRLDDLMIRRTSWRHYRHDHAEVAARAAQWMAAELGWDEATTETEILNYRKQFGSNGAPPHSYSNGNGHGGGLAAAITGSKLGQR